MLTNFFKLGVMFFYGSFAGLSVAYAKALPDLGNETYSIISPQEEKLLGLTWLHQLRKANIIAKNAAINTYLTKVGNELLTNTQQKDLNKFNFFLIEKSEINAFAFLGGNVGIFSGLIAATTTESELAAVLAHEISHVTQKHFVRQILQHKKLTPFTVASSLAMAAVGVPDLILPIAFGGHIQQMLTFSRSHEQEADHMGIQMLERSKFDPRAMGDLFKRFDDLEKHQETPTYLLTHPVFANRITQAYNRTSNKAYKQYLNSDEYTFTKAKIIVELHQDPRTLLTQIETKLANTSQTEQIILIFQKALIYQKLYKDQQAIEIMEKLISEHPDNILLQIFALELILPSNPKLVKVRSAKLATNFPGSLPLSLLHAKALLKLDLPRQAIQYLIPYDHDDLYKLTEEAELYELLISCYQKLAQFEQKLLSQAKLLFLKHELDLAEQKLVQALKYVEKTNNFNNRSKINHFLNNLKKFKQDLHKINL